jgi:hypothetical protein
VRLLLLLLLPMYVGWLLLLLLLLLLLAETYSVWYTYVVRILLYSCTCTGNA